MKQQTLQIITFPPSTITCRMNQGDMESGDKSLRLTNYKKGCPFEGGVLLVHQTNQKQIEFNFISNVYWFLSGNKYTSLVHIAFVNTQSD